MKNSLFLLLALLITVGSYSQVPEGISYQAVAFSASGNPIINGNVGVKISILDNSIQGTVVYSETHLKLTNAQGLFNLNIGLGTPSTGTFSSINWGTNSKFLKVEVDPNGGANYTIVGTNQLMSVPYSLYSRESESSKYILDEYVTIWNNNTTVNLMPNKKYFINANNITLNLPPLPANIDEGVSIEIYVMQHINNPRTVTIDWANSSIAGILHPILVL